MLSIFVWPRSGVTPTNGPQPPEASFRIELVDQCHVFGAAFVVEDAAHVAETDLPVKAQFSVADASQRFQGVLVLGHFPPGRIQRHPPAHQAAKSPPAALYHRYDVGGRRRKRSA